VSTHSYQPNGQSHGDSTPERAVSGRSPEIAAARCLAFAVLSELMASPHDVESALRDSSEAIDLSELPYQLDEFATLVDEFRSAPADELKRIYSSMFEVGSDGPPIPVREDLQTGQKAGVREELVRFYEYFGYELGEKFAWAPDHLSVELEFMHYLTYAEASVLHEHEAAADVDPESFQLAQLDFCERHLINWVPKLAFDVNASNSDSFYSRVTRLLADFLQADFAWQAGTVADAAQPEPPAASD